MNEPITRGASAALGLVAAWIDSVTPGDALPHIDAVGFMR
jgi:hypothetical protein